MAQDIELDKQLSEAALEYHRFGRPGKLAIEPTKRMTTQRELSLAYSPGVAAACLEIVKDPALAREYTVRGNLVAVISNGTAVLGLGNIGPLAGKPVMEGKAVLFKKFADIDVFDIEVDETDVDKFVDIVAALEPTFGAINLEDIKAPQCFHIERKLRERMNIPVFHDDQHGTAITAAAAVKNALKVQGKRLEDVKLVTSGAGAAAIACVDLLVAMGLKPENVTLSDSKGVLYEGRQEYEDNIKPYVHKQNARTLGDALPGADIFMGLSAAKVFKPEWLPLLAEKPLILALANPEPEILPEIVKAHRPDAIMATGRSDYPNQVNNVLCFPFIFRGALDVDASTINLEMEMAAVEAIAGLAELEASETVAAAYGGIAPVFGPDYIIPKPFDQRLILAVAPAVAKAAIKTGVARKPITDWEAYYEKLNGFVFRSGQIMHPVFESARNSGKKIVYALGEDPRVIYAAQTVVEENFGRPVLLGRKQAILESAQKIGIKLDLSKVEIHDFTEDKTLTDALLPAYQELTCRKGIPLSAAANYIQRDAAVVAAMMLRTGMVDAAVCGGASDWWSLVGRVLPLIEKMEKASRIYALSCLVMPTRTLFMCDTHMLADPTAEQLAEMTVLSAEVIKNFGIAPKAALVSHSNFGVSSLPSAKKMREALALIHTLAPDLKVDGEMHADEAITPHLRTNSVLHSGLGDESANLLVMPGIDAANIAFNLLRGVTSALPIGPFLVGAKKPVHFLVPGVTARGIVNISAVAVAEAKRASV